MSQGFAIEGQVMLPKTPFGDLMAYENNAYISATACYGFVPNNFRSFTSLSGTTGATNKLFYASTSTTANSYAAIQSFRSVGYSSGQGVVCRVGGMFNAGVTSTWVGLGLISIADEISFGYDGTAFGVWHRYNGIAEVQTITVTGASAGSTDLTLTLNSVAYTIPLTAGTTAHNAYQIATWLNANQSIWVADQISNTVIISKQSDGPAAGTYSYSHATSTGTVVQNTAGVTKTSVHVPQASWNHNTFSDLDPTKLNHYQIIYKYCGDIQFYVEDANTAQFELAHVIKWSNSNTVTSLSNPSLKFGMYAASTGSTTSTTVRCATIGVFSCGQSYQTRNPRAVKNTQTVSATATNIFSIRNRRTYNYFNNQAEVLLLNLSIASEAPKTVIIDVRTNPVYSGETNFTTIGTNLITDIDTTANTISNGTLLLSFSVAANSGTTINLAPYLIRIPPTLQLSVSAYVTSGASSPVAASLSYYEDI